MLMPSFGKRFHDSGGERFHTHKLGKICSLASCSKVLISGAAPNLKLMDDI